MIARLLARLRSGQGRGDQALLDRPGPAPSEGHLIDANTQTFWRRGAPAPTTLVEAGDDPPRLRARAAGVVAAHERGLAAGGRPRANPAFSEALFVELMRARQWRRAFGLLTPECQQRWGCAEAFAQAQRRGSLSRLSGVRVREVRHLADWRDPESGMVHTHAAELDVEYTIAAGTEARLVSRTVHLVGHHGGWRSLCYPTPEPRR